jgi:hypothetical protein
MRYLQVVLSVAISVVISQPLYSQTISAPTSAEQLLKQFKEAVKAKNKEAVIKLVNWQGVTNEMKVQQQEILDHILQMEVKDIKLTSLPADFKSVHELYGVRYHPNVVIVGYINMKCLKGKNYSDETQIAYGKKNNAFYLAGAIEERISEPTMKGMCLSVTVIGNTFPKPVSFTGTYVYMKGGKEIKDDISSDQGNLSNAFSGDFIKSCKVQKISDFGSIQLIISEDGKKVFESEEVKTNDPIIYEKK